MSQVKAKRIIAAFDFDGTIIRGDSFFELIQLSHNPFQIIMAGIKILPTLVIYLFGFTSNSKAKEDIFRRLYKEVAVENMIKYGERFRLEILPHIINPEAKNRLQWHTEQGHEIVIVSASFQFLLDKWCSQHQYALLCTIPEEKNGKLTGYFATENCYGEEKVRRLIEWWKNNPPDELYVYGDSKGDLPMLALAQFAHYRTFK